MPDILKGPCNDDHDGPAWLCRVSWLLTHKVAIDPGIGRSPKYTEDERRAVENARKRESRRRKRAERKS